VLAVSQHHHHPVWEDETSRIGFSLVGLTQGRQLHPLVGSPDHDAIHEGLRAEHT